MNNHDLSKQLAIGLARHDDGFACDPSRSVDWFCVAAAVGLLMVLALLLRFPLSQFMSPILLGYNEGWNAYRQVAAAGGIRLYGAHPALTVTNYIRETRGAVLCEDLLLCFDAGQPDRYDAYHVRDQEMAGAIDPRVAAARLQSRAFAIVELGAPGSPDQRSPRGRPRFSPQFMQALNANYHSVLSAGDYVVLRPNRRGPD